MHLDEELIQRLLQGELSTPDAEEARAHVGECAECRTHLARARQDAEIVTALLGRLNRPAPPVTAEAIVSRARGFERIRSRWAAGILLMLGAASAAYAVPGSPLRGWVAAVAEWIQGRPEPAPLAPVAPRPSEPALAGISVAPGRHFLIHFTNAQPGSRARVSLTSGTDVVVQAPTGAATFTSGVDRLVIENAGAAAEFEVQIPESAPWVEIRVGNERILLKDGARTMTAGPESSAPYLLPLNPNGGIP